MLLKSIDTTLGAMVDQYGPIFSRINRTFVIISQEAAKECFTTQDRVFSTHPKSLVGEVVGNSRKLMIFQPYGSYWLEICNGLYPFFVCNCSNMFASEVNLFIQGLYLQWTRNRSESKVVVEMKKRFGDLTTDMAVRTVIAGKRYSGTGVQNFQESRRFQEAKGQMKKTADRDR